MRDARMVIPADFRGIGGTSAFTVRVKQPWANMDAAIRRAEVEGRRNRRAMLRGSTPAEVKTSRGPKYLSRREVVERTLAKLSPENREIMLAAMQQNYVSVA